MPVLFISDNGNKEDMIHYDSTLQCLDGWGWGWGIKGQKEGIPDKKCHSVSCAIQHHHFGKYRVKMCALRTQKAKTVLKTERSFCILSPAVYNHKEPEHTIIVFFFFYLFVAILGNFVC